MSQRPRMTTHVSIAYYYWYIQIVLNFYLALIHISIVDSFIDNFIAIQPGVY